MAIPSGVKVRLDGDVRVGGITVDGELYFDPKSSSTIASSGNIVVNGLLHMKPETSAVDHVIEFTGVDERRFVGGGMKPVDSDVGLWVMGDGQLIVEGSPRRGWTTATGSVPKGATSVTVRDATGWRVGDRLSLTPTDRPGPDKIDDDDSDMRSGFHETTIAAISGNTVTFTSPTKEAHPKVDGKYGAELINLTRNVQIRGTASGKAHVFIHTQKYRHFIRWASFQNLGVADALGRYPLHIHHAGDSVNGSLIEGVVVEDGGHHSFVPHESHGLTMRDLVAYQSTGGDAYWWDLTDATNDLVWEHVIAAGVDSSGFYLGRGTNVTIRDAVAVGVENRFTVGGFEWENGSIGSWTAEDLVAHNNLSSGIRVWQNADIPQVIDGYIAYHNHRAAIDHGAYSNRYQYKNGHFFGNLGNAVILHATSDATQISFENLIIDGGGVTQGSPVLMAAANIPATTPTTFRNVEFKGTGSNPIFSFGTATKHQIRCVECRWPGGSTVAVFRAGGPEGNWLEVIDGDQATRYLPNGSTQRIAVPRPLPSGSGTGLRVEYFNEPNLTGLAYTTVLPGTTDPWELQTARPGYGAEPYHRLSVQDGYSARWTGELEIAVGEAGPYEFFSRFSAGIRVTIDGRTLIDDWDNTGLNGDYTDPYSAGYNKASFNLSPGRHDIEIELRDTTSGGGFWGSQFSLSWQYGGDLREVIPASRLYPSGPVPNNEPTAATPPR